MTMRRRQVWIVAILAGIIGSLTGSLVTMWGVRDKSNRETPIAPTRGFVRPHLDAVYNVHTSEPVLEEEAEITIEKCLSIVSGALEMEREPKMSRQILRAAQAALEEVAKTAIKELEGGVSRGAEPIY